MDVRTDVGILSDMIRSLRRPNPEPHSFLKSAVGGAFYRVSDIKSESDVADIRTLIQTMRALAKDSQVSTALSYYATDATTPNSSGDIIWATSIDGSDKQCAELVNTLFKRWKINTYARDHILELATVGNLYIPTTEMKREVTSDVPTSNMYIGLDNNDIPESNYDIIPSHKIDPEDIIHIWSDYEPYGYIYDPETTLGSKKYSRNEYVLLPETSVIHFSLGGVIGNYSIEGVDAEGNDVEYDIQFANPLMTSAVQPTQTLNLLEDSTVLSSLTKIIRFICIDAKGADETEVTQTLTQFKDLIEQQISLNTGSGDAQSFLNPPSPNNIIYLPRVNNTVPIDIVDLNMRDEGEGNDKLLEYYQDKKLSVLGIPKEAMNFSSSEGLGGAGAVMSQRSALYANSLQRIETAYINGWTDAINKYFEVRNLPQFVDKFELHMNPILTEMSTVQFEKRDSAISQATSIVELMKSLNIDSDDDIKSAMTEILSEALPRTSSSVNDWDIDVSASPDEEMM